MNGNNNDIEFEHAWSHFKVNAKQRLTIFRYYIIIFAITVSAAGITASMLPSIIGFCILLLIGFLLCFLSYQFKQLDDRTNNLIDVSKMAMMHIETNMNPEVQIFSKDNNQTKKKTYTSTLNTIFNLGMLLGVLLILVSICMLVLCYCKKHPCPIYKCPCKNTASEIESKKT